MSSACTGTGMAEVVHIMVHSMYGGNAKGSFSCEKIPWKQKFYRKVVEWRMHHTQRNSAPGQDNLEESAMGASQHPQQGSQI